jgi:hypothetical protein
LGIHHRTSSSMQQCKCNSFLLAKRTTGGSALRIEAQTFLFSRKLAASHRRIGLPQTQSNSGAVKEATDGCLRMQRASRLYARLDPKTTGRLYHRFCRTRTAQPTNQRSGREYAVQRTSGVSPLAVAEGRANVVAVIESLNWNGGASDPLMCSCYMSAENAMQLRQFTASSIESLGFCVINFDAEEETWFAEFHPQAPVKIICELNKAANNESALKVAEAPTQISPGISLWGIQVQLLPSAAQEANLAVATRVGNEIVSSWRVATSSPGPSSAPTNPPSTPASLIVVLEEAATSLAAELPRGLGNPF